MNRRLDEIADQRGILCNPSRCRIEHEARIGRPTELVQAHEPEPNATFNVGLNGIRQVSGESVDLAGDEVLGKVESGRDQLHFVRIAAGVSHHRHEERLVRRRSRARDLLALQLLRRGDARGLQHGDACERLLEQCQEPLVFRALADERQQVDRVREADVCLTGAHQPGVVARRGGLDDAEIDVVLLVVPRLHSLIDPDVIRTRHEVEHQRQLPPRRRAVPGCRSSLADAARDEHCDGDGD